MQVRAVMLALATLLIAAPARAENVVRWATILQPSGLDPHAFCEPTDSTRSISSSSSPW